MPDVETTTDVPRSWTLASMTLVNWGTYDGTQTISLTPTREGGRNATCIVGENGSGKTTLTDAYMMLIRPESSTFNAASNAASRGDDRRTVISYMRGEVGDDPETGRPHLIRPTDIVMSVIRGHFEDGDGRVLEAAILMWLNVITDVREKRLYLTSDAEIDLSMLAGLTADEFSAKGVARRLGRDVTINERPSEYQRHLSETFGISHEWTEFRKFTRLLSMVQGEETPDKRRINELFKNYVLPASDVPKRVSDTSQAISDNLTTLEELSDKKSQIDALQSMQASFERMQKTKSELDLLCETTATRVSRDERDREMRLTDTGEVAPIALYATEYRIHHLEGLIGRTKAQEQSKQAALDAAKLEEGARKKDYDDAYERMRQSGNKLVEAMQRRIDDAQAGLDAANVSLKKAEAEQAMRARTLDEANKAESDRRRIAERERARLSRMRTTVDGYIQRGRPYGLSAWPKSHDAWNNMLATISSVDMDEEAAAKARQIKLQDERFTTSREIENLKATLARLQGSRAKLSAAYPRLTEARDRIARAMNISPDSLPFLAELVNVLPDQQEWSIAANACLAPVSKRMLIDVSMVHKFRAISKDVERDLGIRVSYTEVDTLDDDDWLTATFDDDTVAAKLEVDQASEYAASAIAIIANNNAQCIEDASHFEDGARQVTKGGQTRFRNRGTIGFNRRDADVLGFVSKSDIEDIEDQIKDCENDLRSTLVALNKIEGQLKDIERQRSFAEQMHDVSFEDLDIEAQSATVSAATADIDSAHDFVVASEDALSESEQACKRCHGAIADAKDALEAARRDYRQAVDNEADVDRELREQRQAAEDAYHEARDLRRALESEQARIRTDLAEQQRRMLELRDVDTSALREDTRTLLDQWVGPLPDDTPWASFESQCSSHVTSARTRIESRQRELTQVIERLCADFASQEPNLGDLSWESLTGIAHQSVMAEVEAAGFADLDLTEPWNHTLVSWSTYYAHMLKTIVAEWNKLDIVEAKRNCALQCADAIETLIANARTTEHDIAHRIRDVDDILSKVRLGSDDHTLNVRHNFRKGAAIASTYERIARICDHIETPRNMAATEHDLDEVIEVIADIGTILSKEPAAAIAALDPNSYVNISFVEMRDGMAHNHANLTKLSGGEVQQISACVIGAALLYAMNTAPGESPTYATIVIDEAFVKADEAHSVATLKTLIDMGFVPIVSMPPEGVMKLSPCLSRLIDVTRHGSRSYVRDISLDELLATT